MLLRHSDRSRLHRRQCVACGYNGGLVERLDQPNCPKCDCDFSVRPPRSYAQMEGLEESDFVNARKQRAMRETSMPRERSLLARWILFVFVVTTLAATIAMLGIAALQTR